MSIKSAIRSQILPLEGKIALLLSSGVDSNSLLFECLEQGKDVVCYTFRLDGVDSVDSKMAKANCLEFGVVHREIILPNSLATLIEDLQVLKSLGCKLKTEYECFWVFLYVYPAIKESTILSGMGADHHFCISKTGMMHYKETRIDEFRRMHYENPEYCQGHIHKRYDSSANHIMPYLSDEVIESFKGLQWSEINKPRQKQVIIDLYPKYFSRINIKRHMSYHKGDSGIAKQFERLLDTELNPGRKFKSVVSIYNRVVDPKVQKPMKLPFV